MPQLVLYKSNIFHFIPSAVTGGACLHGAPDSQAQPCQPSCVEGEDQPGDVREEGEQVTGLGREQEQLCREEGEQKENEEFGQEEEETTLWQEEEEEEKQKEQERFLLSSC